MAIIKTEAITLRTTDFSDTSQVLQFLTGSDGVVSALARGSKRPNSPFQGAIDVLTLNEIVYYQKRSSLHELAEVDQITTFPGLRCDVSRVYCASYAVELVYLLARDTHHPKELFDLLRTTLYTIERSRTLPQTVISFEIAALRVAGFEPMLDHCTSCGGAIRNQGCTNFSPLQGGLLCSSCSAEVTDALPVAPGAVSIARALAGGISKPARVKISPKQAIDLRILLDRFIETTLGSRLKTKQYLSRI